NCRVAQVEAPLYHQRFVTVSLTRSHGDKGRWAVRPGRHPLEKVSRGAKDWLRRDRTPPVRAKPKASLTVFPMIRNTEEKSGLSDPSCPHYWGLVVTEKLP